MIKIRLDLQRQKALFVFFAMPVLLFYVCGLSYAGPIEVGSATADTTIQSGYQACVNEGGCTIQVQTGTYFENDTFGSNIVAALVGGYNSGFSTNSGEYSTIAGTLTISNGATNFWNITIQPPNQSIVGEWLVVIRPIGTFIYNDGLGTLTNIFDTHYFYLLVNSDGSLSATIADCILGQTSDCTGSISVSGSLSGNTISNFLVATQGSIFTDNCGSELYSYSLTGTLTPNSSGSISAGGTGTDSFTQSAISSNCGSFIADICGNSSTPCFAATKQ